MKSEREKYLTGVVEAQDETIAFAQAKITALSERVSKLERRDELVREAMFTLSDRLRKVGALDSDNVHSAYEAVVAALSAGDK